MLAAQTRSGISFHTWETAQNLCTGSSSSMDSKTSFPGQYLTPFCTASPFTKCTCPMRISDTLLAGSKPPRGTLLVTHHRLVSDQRIPNAGHCLSNAQVGVKLVTVEPGKKLGQKWSQLLSSLGSYHIETKSCSLKWQQNSICWNIAHSLSYCSWVHQSQGQSRLT